ncbi:hypothetical protein Bca52824_087307 [Brassica carinata]|uniref:Uncharacterized protein n=1 Tax=Brassica carinata TaxID=52824 RepID=A0A8X7TN42_BRACI|nr:hypothetical protein Bca52824_087307 [Brassica carinata]
MEGTKFNSNETTPQESFTKETLVGTDVDNQSGPVVADNRLGPDNQSSSDNQSGPVIAAAEVVSGQVETPTGSPSRYHLLSNELEEGEVEEDILEKKKHMGKQKSGKKKKSQKSNLNINVRIKKDQNKGAKNKQKNQASSRRH